MHIDNTQMHVYDTISSVILILYCCRRETQWWQLQQQRKRVYAVQNTAEKTKRSKQINETIANNQQT